MLAVGARLLCLGLGTTLEKVDGGGGAPGVEGGGGEGWVSGVGYGRREEG